MTIREVLNRIFWDKRESPEDYEVTFIHRGAYMDRKTVPCGSIDRVRSSWFTYESEEEGEVLIPFHRVLEIRNVKTGQLVWRKKGW